MWHGARIKEVTLSLYTEGINKYGGSPISWHPKKKPGTGQWKGGRQNRWFQEPGWKTGLASQISPPGGTMAVLSWARPDAASPTNQSLFCSVQL